MRRFARTPARSRAAQAAPPVVDPRGDVGKDGGRLAVPAMPRSWAAIPPNAGAAVCASGHAGAGAPATRVRFLMADNPPRRPPARVRGKSYNVVDGKLSSNQEATPGTTRAIMQPDGTLRCPRCGGVEF